MIPRAAIPSSLTCMTGWACPSLKKAGMATILRHAQRNRRTLRPRARDMRVSEVYEDIFPERGILDKVLKKYKVTADEVCFVGDDLVDTVH